MEKKIESATIAELLRPDTDGSIPVLLDIYHKDIEWGDLDNEQEAGHLRLINANYSVKYNGHSYMSSVFTFSPPQEDGKKVGNANITISAIDKRIIEIIRSVSSKPVATIEAFFVKNDNEVSFSRLFNYEFEMTSVSWDGISAKWNLVFDPVSILNIPRDLATQARCPAVVKE